MTAPKVTTTAHANGSTIDVQYHQVVGPPSPLPVEGMFKVAIDGLYGFSLIPLNDLARDLIGVWLHGDTRKAWEGVTRYPALRGYGKALRFTMENTPLLSGGGDPFFTGESITAEEHNIARAAIAAHREAKRPKQKPKPVAKKRRRTA